MPQPRRLLAWFLLTASFCLPAKLDAAPPKAPPPPGQYDVRLRFRIRAAPQQRRVQFEEMLRELKQLGFEPEPEPDAEDVARDPGVEQLAGTVPSAQARQLLRVQFVQSLLLSPAGYKFPAADQRVTLDIDLAAGLTPDQQLLLHEQARDRLALTGFTEAVGYDHRGFTRVVGTLPAGEAPYLLKDLRSLPGGWVLPATADLDIPAPLRNVVGAVRVVEVRAGEVAPDPVTAFRPAPGAEYQWKITADLRERLAAPGEAPLRLEVVLARPLADTPDGGRSLVASVPGVQVEGRFGEAVTFLAPAAAVDALAQIPAVVAVRLPRSGRPDTPPFARPPAGADTAELLRASRVDQMHRQGIRGQGVRIAVIDGDFTGALEQLGKGLPARTRLIDLTAERSRDLRPDPQPGTGSGTRCALAAALAAPDAELVLIRIDPAAAHQLLFVTQLIAGESPFSDSLTRRAEELLIDATDYRTRRGELAARRQQLFADFTSEERPLADEELTEEERRLPPEERQRLTPRRRWEIRRDKLQAELDALDRAERQLTLRLQRYDFLQADLRTLRGIGVIACPLVWNDGYAQEGLSALGRYLDHPPPARNGRVRVMPMWFQAAGDTRGQGWVGTFTDADGNGVMEFRPAGSELPPDLWTPELNFLRFAPLGGGEPAADLPAGARVRVTVQWAEPHDASLGGPEEGLYRVPLAQLRLRVLRQLDPAGQARPSDDLAVVGESQALPQRLYDTANYSVYEQQVEFTAAAAGRFALRVEGGYPSSIRPPVVASLPAQQRNWELKVRLFAGLLDDGSRAQGRVVFREAPLPPVWPRNAGAGEPNPFAGLSGVGTPGGTRASVTVGAADPTGAAEPFSAVGAGPDADLRIKPDLLAFDRLPLGDGPTGGTTVATGFAAGIGASLLSAHGPRTDFGYFLHIPPGALLTVPEGWLRERAEMRPVR